MTTLLLDPALDRQLAGDGHLMLLWRTGRGGTHREGLLLVVGVCPFPGCPDRQVWVDGYLVGDTLRAVTCAPGELRFTGAGGGGGPSAASGRAFGVAVGLDDGAVEVVDAVWNRRAVAWLEEALDAEIRALLQLRFERARAVVDAMVLPDDCLEAVLAGLQRGLRAQDERLPALRAGLLPAKRPLGRNEPCPCGSGRKFKRCCLGAA